MTITADEAGGLGRGMVEFLSQPGGGQLVVQADDGGRTVVSTASTRNSDAMWLRMPTTPDTRSVTVSTMEDGPVDVLGWEVAKGGPKRPAPGILYSNLGITGSTIDILSRVDPEILSEEIRHLNPSLLIVAFGTNEGFNNSTAFDSYSARYEQVIQTLHGAAPMAGLVVVLPPDGVRQERLPPSSGRANNWPPQAGDSPRQPPLTLSVRRRWISHAVTTGCSGTGARPWRTRPALMGAAPFLPGARVTRQSPRRTMSTC